MSLVSVRLSKTRNTQPQHAALRPSRRHSRRLSPIWTRRLPHSIIAPARRRAFRNSSTRYLETRPLRKGGRVIGPADLQVTASHLERGWARRIYPPWNPSSRARRPLFCCGMPQWEYGKLSQSVGVRVRGNRIVVVCRASVQRATAIGSRIVHRYWIALQSRLSVPWPVQSPEGE